MDVAHQFSSADLPVSALRSRSTGSHGGDLNILHYNKALLNFL